MRLIWSGPASADLDAIQRHIASDNLTAAGRMRERLVAAPQELVAQPMMGRAGKMGETRELVIPRSPYLLIYRVTADAIVLRVVHGAQRWPPAGEG